MNNTEYDNGVLVCSEHHCVINKTLDGYFFCRKCQCKDIKHLRQAARCSCNSYIGRMTRQSLNRQADEKQKELKSL